jgi:CBS domain-containing protein
MGRTRDSRRGSSTIEYALMLSLVTAAVLLIAMTVGDQVKQVLGKLDGAMAQNVAANPEVVASEGQRTSSLIAEPPLDRTAVFKLAGLMVLSVVLAGSAITLTVARRRVAKTEEGQPKPAPPKPQPGYLGKRQEILKSLASAGREVLHNELAAAQIMSQRLTKVLPETSLVEVRKIMGKRQLRHVLVCDAKDKLMGVISDRDMPDDKEGFARDIMTRDPITIQPETRASALVSILLDRRISCLPVVESGTLVGIVTMSDIAMTLQCTLQLIEQMVDKLEVLTDGGTFVVSDAEIVDKTAECSLSA